MQEKVKEVHQEMEELKDKINKREYLEYIMGDSKKIKEVHKAVEKVAQTDFSVVIIGETGTGKEIIASSIHNFSNRKDKRLISIEWLKLGQDVVNAFLHSCTRRIRLA